MSRGILCAPCAFMRRWFPALGLAFLSAAACAGRGAPQTVGDPSQPNVGWVIMHGRDYNPDEEFGCQSNPRSECAVNASSPAEKTLSEVHVYFHPAKTDTTYTGTVKVGFFSDSGTSSGMKVDAKVKPGDVGSHSVIGLVTDKPGRYTMKIDITATAQSGIERQIREDVSVDVQRRPGVPANQN